MPIVLNSYACDQWVAPEADLVDIPSAVDGEIIAQASSTGLHFGEMIRYARDIGGPALRAMTFHERADRLQALAEHLGAAKEPLYDIAYHTGATKTDNQIDIEGGIGALLAYAQHGRRDLPNERFLIEGGVEDLGRGSGFVGRHVMTPLAGVAVHINAFAFPVWGMLEKLAPALLAGMPVIAKAATPTAYVTEALVRQIVAAGLLPAGSLQFVVGSAGDLLDHLTGQDVLSFTGSIETSERLRNHPAVSRNAVRFIAERDSLNAAVLGPDAVEGTPEFELFVEEVVRQMTTKAGQNCSAIRRIIVPRQHVTDVSAHISAALAKVTMGDPRNETNRMGALASVAQRAALMAAVEDLVSEADIVFGDLGHNHGAGAFFAPLLLRARDSRGATKVHTLEPFGPVATVLTYDTIEEAAALVAKGEGGLVASVFTYDPDVACALVFGIASYHGRVVVIDRDCATGAVGQGLPVPALVHGGPGRAGGGEELGGLRAIMTYMQRTALQGSPARLASLTKSWIRGAATPSTEKHPFTYHFDDLTPGYTITTPSRTITLDDIEHFAEFTGDTSYAHMDEAAASANPLLPGRVAHGHLLLSFASGLFADPAPGPLLANYGLENLRFMKPVSPGDAIRVRVTVKSKHGGKPDYGEVRWDVEIFNQSDETVAQYDLLTKSARVAAIASVRDGIQVG